jgi:hypothetical protein
MHSAGKELPVRRRRDCCWPKGPCCSCAVLQVPFVAAHTLQRWHLISWPAYTGTHCSLEAWATDMHAAGHQQSLYTGAAVLAAALEKCKSTPKLSLNIICCLNKAYSRGCRQKHWLAQTCLGLPRNGLQSSPTSQPLFPPYVFTACAAACKPVWAEIGTFGRVVNKLIDSLRGCE